MKKANKLIGMAVGAAMLGASGLANATTVDLEPAGLGVPLSFSGFAPVGDCQWLGARKKPPAWLARGFLTSSCGFGFIARGS